MDDRYRVEVKQRVGRLAKDAKSLAPLQRAQQRRETKPAQVLGVGLGRAQPIGEAAAAHQREDEARRLGLQVVSEQWQ
eukprot:scaffold18079_cov65-Phaeocystis_antarctica.AAC.14